jgi:hypothetical protein
MIQTSGIDRDPVPTMNGIESFPGSIAGWRWLTGLEEGAKGRMEAILFDRKA